MQPPAADNIVQGVAAGAGAMLLRLLGVEPGTLMAAAAACVLGAPFARPAGSPWRAVVTWCASVVVTCHAATGAAALLLWWWPAGESYAGKLTALAAVLIGVALHVIVSSVPVIVPGLLARMGVKA